METLLCFVLLEEVIIPHMHSDAALHLDCKSFRCLKRQMSGSALNLE